MGLPQNWHVGRPRCATSAPWRDSANICSRVANNRTRLGVTEQERLRVVVFHRGLELLDLQLEQVLVLVEPDREFARAPPRFERLLQRHRLLTGALAGLEFEVGEQLEDGGGQQLHLFLLDGDGDQLAAGAGLEIERAITGFTDRVGGDSVDRTQFHKG